MTGLARSLATAPAWIATLVALTAGALWRDCVLIGGSLLLALNAFYVGMDSGSPCDGWRAAIRCWRAGVLSMLGALGLLAMAAGFLLGAWPMASHDRHSALLVLGLAVALASFSGTGLASGWRGHAWAGIALVAAVAAELGFDRGVAFAPCVFAIAVALTMVWLGRRLAHDATLACLRAGER
jgi:hypothetical protein